MRERREVGIGAVTGRIPKGPPVCFIATEARHGAQRYGVHACMRLHLGTTRGSGTAARGSALAPAGLAVVRRAARVPATMRLNWVAAREHTG